MESRGKKMLKKLATFSLFIMIFCGSAYAQSEGDQAQKEKPKFGFHMNFSIGLSNYEDSDGDNITYQKLGIFPEFSYGKFALGLDLTLELDEDFQLRDLDNDGKADRWTSFTDYLYRIYYVRYGQKGDAFYGRIGAISGYTLGHGSIVSEYTNTVFYPQVINLGLNLDIDGTLFKFPFLGVEFLVDDVLDWDIIGGRLYLRPLGFMPVPVLKNLQLGGTLVTDIDPQEVPVDSPEDNSASVSVSVYGFDIGIPLIDKQDVSLLAYVDWAQIREKGNGFTVGSTFNYRWFTLLGQLRFFGEEFVPHYFDPFYERDRAAKFNSLDLITDRYAGYFIGTDLSLFEFLNLYFYWEDGFDTPEGPRIQTGIGITENALAKFGASLSYDKKDIDDFSDFFDEEDSLLELRVAYRITTGTSIVFIYERTFTPFTNEPATRTYVETQFSF
jgi:hypothetical protein